MSIYSKRYYGNEANQLIATGDEKDGYNMFTQRKIRPGSTFNRVMGALLDGGKSGVDIGLSIIPGNIIICTLVMLITRTPAEPGVYTGAAMEGIGLLPKIAESIGFILDPLFGFTSAEAIAFPCTAVDSVGASLGMVPGFLANNLLLMEYFSDETGYR